MTEEMKPCLITEERIDRAQTCLEHEGVTDAEPIARAVLNSDDHFVRALMQAEYERGKADARSPALIASAGGEDGEGQAIAAAYVRGAEWLRENPGNYEFLVKAAYDYADKTTSGRPLSSDTGDGAAVEYERGWIDAQETAAKAAKQERHNRAISESAYECGVCNASSNIEKAIRALPTPTAPSISK